MSKRRPLPPIRSLPAAAWRIVLAIAMVWASMLMVVPAAQAIPGMDMPMHHAVATADADAPSGLVHDMGGNSHEECVVCALCSALTVSSAPARLTLGEANLKPMALLTLAGLDRSPDQRPPIPAL